MTIPSTTTPMPGPNSRVLTVIAWLSLGISLAMFGALISTLVRANASRAAIDPVGQMLQDTAFVRVMPPALVFQLRHPVLTTLVQFVVWMAAVISSVGLLRRRDWARRLFIALLALAIVRVLFWSYVGVSMVQQAFGTVALPFFLVAIGVVAPLLWWIVWLRSARIRAEFAAGESAA